MERVTIENSFKKERNRIVAGERLVSGEDFIEVEEKEPVCSLMGMFQLIREK